MRFFFPFLPVILDRRKNDYILSIIFLDLLDAYFNISNSISTWLNS